MRKFKPGDLCVSISSQRAQRQPTRPGAPVGTSGHEFLFLINENELLLIVASTMNPHWFGDPWYFVVTSDRQKIGWIIPTFLKHVK